MRRALITLLQALENRTPLGPDVELHAATTQELAKLLRSSAPITAKQVRLVRRLDYRQQRQAGVLKASASGTKRTTRKVISKLAKPQAGMFRKKLLGKRAASSRVGLYALMVTAASKSSGSVSAQLFDDPGLRSVQFDTTSGNRNISGSFWQSTTGIQNCVYADLAPEQFASYVLGGAYDGDLAELQFSELRAVSVSTSLQIEGVSYSRGMNLVGKVSLPGNFARIFPPTLTIFGPFDPDARTTGSANLRTAPQFDLALGRWILRKCYLHIQTEAENGLWDSEVYVNGTFSLLGFDLPMSSHLSTQDGFLSFNLETTEMPFQPPEQLDALNALFPLAELEKPWAQAQNLLRAGRGFALTGLNFTFDVTTATVSSLWLRLRLPGFDIQGPFASRFSAIEISWLVGLTSSAPEVSTSGWVAEVAVAGFEGAKWECYVKPWPELHFSLWTPSDGLSIDSVFAQLSNAGAKITPEQISLASGFFLTRYGNRLEVHIGLPGRNAVRIL